MFAFFENPYRVLKLSTLLLTVGLAMFVIGVLLAYGLETDLSMPVLLGAHLMSILGPTSIKIGYVLRLQALNRLRPQTTPWLSGA
ncbi:transmembrane sensor/regulator PpyR [Zestomonas carbonaria]|uniref:Transmembrane sensor/regulator PpyR n=1 Tax=Zestomonas carbonaria TaxID=2762745 RepID=A0A7U7EM23_9GAMM|nr:transmembrane sensor/regulator PpyR [Pseudomonas carbonaria]CAD5106610.1 hypothetical protein PSEWESI4_00875 [Pseudomonas carbonaria]